MRSSVIAIIDMADHCGKSSEKYSCSGASGEFSFHKRTVIAESVLATADFKWS